MLAKLRTFSRLGIEAVPVEVEVDVSAAAMPKNILVGSPEAAVKESTHRVERAMVNSGFQRPHNRVVINLAPAGLPKQAASFDLPITLGVLAGSGQLASERFEQYAVVGELSLEGHTRPAKEVLSMALAAARQHGLRGIVVPDANAHEAAVVEELKVIPVSSLARWRRSSPGTWISTPRHHGCRNCSRRSPTTTTTTATCAARNSPNARW